MNKEDITYELIKELVFKYPNNDALGEAIRKLIFELQSKNN